MFSLALAILYWQSDRQHFAVLYAFLVGFNLAVGILSLT